LNVNTKTPPRKKSQWRKYRNDPDLTNEATERDYKNQFKKWRNYAKGHPHYFQLF